MSIKLKVLIVFSVFVLAAVQLSGCTTVTALAEGAAESINPTVMASLDSVESSAMAIKLSNRVLLDIPITEHDEWPAKLRGSVSGAGAARMGASLAGSAFGVTIPTELDTETGFPRPTSALYIFLKEREMMLDRLDNKKEIAYFSNKPKTVIYLDRSNIKSADGSSDPPVYRNALMAYGVVAGNKNEIIEMQREIDNKAKGFKTCNYFLHNSTAEIDDVKIIKKSCPDTAFLKNEEIVANLAIKISDIQEEKAIAEKEYRKLANNVYKCSIAGADFTAAAITKISFAIVNIVRALPNIKNEFAGLKGAYNVAVMIPRAKNIFKSMGVYKDNLAFQWTVYKTMYQQVKGTYEIKDDEPAKKSIKRIKAVEMFMAQLEPKLNLALAGERVQFSDAEVGNLNMLDTMFPTGQELERDLISVWK